MTALDAGVALLLLLLAAGGYRQGFVRGLLRLAALAAIGAAAAVLSLGLSSGGTVEGVLLRAGLLFGGVVIIVSTAAWVSDTLVPYRVHRAALNMWLGVVPALVIGLLVLGAALGIAHRIAIEEWQRYLADGLITGPLTWPLQWLERALVTTLSLQIPDQFPIS